MGRIAIFIDGAYLRNVLKEEFGTPKIDYRRLVEKMAQARELLRAYYYDCPPYQSQRPTEEEAERFRRHEKFVYALNQIPRFQVRQGRLEYRGKNEDGKPVFHQKRVDILLGVDLALLSAKHQITDAAVLAGDSDFLPAIEAAKSEGVVMHLFHGNRPHRDLVSACDERTPIDSAFLDLIRQ
jgi:uncharacterized LabA/DUF88 family protein